MDNSPLPMIIIQNKLDIKKEKNLEEKDTEIQYLEEFANKNKFEAFFQTSAKTGENVDSAITQFLNLIIEKYEKYYTNASVDDDARTDNVKLEKQSFGQKKKCC
jgi:GTPase Era involved in 16S rRNA processing